ncbi:MAG: acireductone synthase [Pyrinomonadaceae bacterium]
MIKAILLDIEGTTTPIDFVHQTLFPFARERIGRFLEENDSADETAQLEAEYRKDFTDQLYGRHFNRNEPESVADYLRFLIEQDRKSTPLKSLQGKIWREGYRSGELKSVVFEDVLPAFERWTAAGKSIFIYSSGSVLAQKLLFKYTDHGDLTRFISGYFDTNTGGKREAESYRRIASVEGFPPVENSLFISDVPAELDAAKKAGFSTRLSVREGNPPYDESRNSHPVIRSFDELE